MVILNIETSTGVCSAAATEDATVLCSRMSTGGNHAHDLPLFIEDILSCLREQNKTLDAVAVSAGPGSYTGLRIGTATAKGLCYGLGIPLVAIDTLQVLCASFVKGMPQQTSERPQLLCPMIDARRMEVYTALYDTDLVQQSEVKAEVIGEDSFAAVALGSRLVFFGNGAEKCKGVIRREDTVFVDGIVPDARYMGELAEHKLKAGEKADVAYFTPFYLKEFQATVSHKAEDVLKNDNINQKTTIS